MNRSDFRPFPLRPSLEQYKKQAKDFVKLGNSGETEVLQRIGKWHPRSGQLLDSGALRNTLVLADAQLVIAREHGFESWPKFVKHIEGLARERSPVSNFELAAEAIVTGDIGALESLLRECPELVGARSTRLHRATLLHYLGVNGFEDYRQKSPKNAVEIAKILLSAGAEVNALADIYGKSTTLGLVATSIYPRKAGVQIALLEILLGYSAAIGGVPGVGSPLIAALHNGRPEAAEFLARQGAELDLEGAAGVGRLDVVQSFFNGDGTLKANGTKAQMESGFMWACEYGRNDVVNFLLKQGMNISAQDNHGMTGLHWAAVGRQPETIKLLLERGASLVAKNVYGGTVLGQATWCADHGDPDINYFPVIEMLIHAGAKVENGSEAALPGLGEA